MCMCVAQLTLPASCVYGVNRCMYVYVCHRSVYVLQVCAGTCVSAPGCLCVYAPRVCLYVAFIRCSMCACAFIAKVRKSSYTHTFAMCMLRLRVCV